MEGRGGEGRGGEERGGGIGGERRGGEGNGLVYICTHGAQLHMYLAGHPNPAYSAMIAVQVLFEGGLQSIDHLILQVLYILQCRG